MRAPIAVGLLLGLVATTAAEPPPQPQVKLGTPVVVGELDKAIVRRYIRRNLAKLQYCYERELLARPTLAGAVTVMFTIVESGSVANVVAIGLPGVSPCVESAVRSIQFPQPKSGTAKVMYPLTYRRS
jgi:hypothetical protein